MNDEPIYRDLARQFQEKQREAHEMHQAGCEDVIRRMMRDHLAKFQREFSERALGERSWEETCVYCGSPNSHSFACPRFTDVYPAPIGSECHTCDELFTPDEHCMYLPGQLANVFRQVCLGCAAIELVLEMESE